ncbi:DUF3592 domain-containing protein [Microbispora siamensis]|uniref:DUF3592 domain-containing protein n=1 Tax=Microbispora siamensis TaxID=564413 RepID=UPI00195176E8|nr:DUF3592 domain-containing protein [Microbispora siamensis]
MTFGVFSLLFLTLTVFLVIEMNQTRTILARGVRAEAMIVDAQHYRYRGDLVVVRFSTPTGEHVTTDVSDSIDASEIHPGDSMDIVYDQVHPERVISAGITSISHYYALIPLSIIGVIAMAWLCIRSWALPLSRA